jgi:hypothetical protein
MKLLLDDANSNQNFAPKLQVHCHLEQIIPKTDLWRFVSQYLYIINIFSGIAFLNVHFVIKIIFSKNIYDKIKVENI